MEKKNKYANRSKIPEDKFKQMVRLFAEDFTAGQIAEISNINRNTVNRYLMAIRQRIASSCEEPTAAETAQRSGVRASRGLHPLAISDGPEKGMPLVRVQAETGSFIRLRGCSGCDGLIRIGQDELYKVEYGQKENDENPDNEIEEFWGFAKTRLTQFYGLPKSTFYLHLKECEFRFNHKDEDLYRLLLKTLQNNPLF